MISKIYKSNLKLFKAWSRKGKKRDFKKELEEQAKKEKAKTRLEAKRVNPNYSQAEIKRRISENKRSKNGAKGS